MPFPTLFRIRRLAALALIAAHPSGAPAAPVPSATAVPLADFEAASGVASADEPRFAWANPATPRAEAGQPLDIAARALARTVRAGKPLSPRALAAIETRRVQRLGAPGRQAGSGAASTIVVLGQRVDGLEVMGAELKLLFDAERRLVASGGALVAELPSENRAASRFRLAPLDALGIAVHEVAGVTPSTSSWRDTGDEDRFGRRWTLSEERALDSERVLIAPARVGRFWYPLAGALRPAYRIELSVGASESTEAESFLIVVDAESGRLLRRRDLTQSESFTYRVWAESSAPWKPLDGPLEDVTPHPTGLPDDTIPGFEPSTLVTIDGFNSAPGGGSDSWLTPGTVTTKGNNVDAYSDFIAPDGFNDGDLRASTTSALTFDREYELGAEPLSSGRQTRAAVTQLFYTTNWLHDDWYDSGFDEAAGNAQKSNYGRGGIGGDELHAEAQDGAVAGSRNNASMTTPADGTSPRMQMFLWRSPFEAHVVSSIGPAPVTANRATYGPPEFDLAGVVALANDGSGDPADGCQPITGSVAGKIALVHFGTCGSVQKVAFAQSADAIGVIVTGTTPGAAAPALSGANPSIDIPTLSIPYEAGAAIEAALGSGPVSASLHLEAGVERSGDLDNLIVAHEWGHYLHRRLVDCGNKQCGAQSEGWGDFVGLHLAIRDGDPTTTGTYASTIYAPLGPFPDAAYFGLRRYPYSRDLAKNPLRLRHLADGEPLPAGPPLNAKSSANSEVHNSGEVWASMLLDAYGELLDRHPYALARRRMADIVVTGMELAPADPTFTEQRDALLAAALAVDAGDFQAMRTAFARRGAGSCAISPPRDSNDFLGVVEDDSVGRARLAIDSIALSPAASSCDGDAALDAGESGTLRVRVRNTGGTAIGGFTLQLGATGASGASGASGAGTNGLVFANGGLLAGGSLPAFGSTEMVAGVTAANTLLGAPLVHLEAQASGASLCEAVSGASIAFVGYDTKPSARDSASLDSGWNETGTAGGIWRRSLDPLDFGNLVYAGSDSPVNADVRFESPALQVSAATPFVVSFSHRHSFETSGGVLWDGGVVELSSDGGAIWSDVAALVDPGYGGTLTAISHNPLALRPAFVARNAAWPARERVTLDFGTQLAGETIRLRFRIGSDDAVGDLGWEIDDIAVSGIVNLPFLALAPNVHPCAGAPLFSDGFSSGDTSFWSATGSG